MHKEIETEGGEYHDLKIYIVFNYKKKFYNLHFQRSL